MGLQPFDAQKAQEIAIKAFHIAESMSHEYVTVEHLLSALLHDTSIIATLKDLEVSKDDLEKELVSFFQGPIIPISPTGRKPRRTLAIQRVVDTAVTQVMFSGRRAIATTDILLALLHEEDCQAAFLLKSKGLDEAKLKLYLAHGKDGEEETATNGPAASTEETPVDSDQKAEKALRKYCVLLNERAKEGKIDPLIGRYTEVENTILILSRRQKNNVVYVGEPGVGKTAIVEGLALRIEQEDVPEVLHGAQIWSLDIGALMAGTKYRGDLEERLKIVLKSIAKLNETRKIVLFIDEMHMIMGAGSGSQGSMDVSNLIKPALARGELRCIGSTTYDEYRKHFEKDRGLLRRFQKLDIAEPSVEDSKLILRGLAETYEAFHNVSYDVAALDAAVELTARYVTDKVLPDKAIDVIDIAGARKRVMRDDGDEEVSFVTVDDIEVEVAKIAKLPARTVKEEESDQLAGLENDLLSVVFDQEPAIKTLTETVYLSRSGLREPNKPQGSYLFTGNSGSGKTETAKQLAKTLAIPLIRFDMSEYMEKHAVSKLIGAPPGYVGFSDGAGGSGLLTNAVETHPRCVLLLDEIEKAHPDLFSILLQVMDDGHLTNGAGKTVNFKNVILIMTSNAGAAEMSKNALGFGREKIEGEDDKAVNQLFAPEFRNRLDAIVKFNAIKPETMIKIVDKFLAQLNVLSADKNVKVEVSIPAKEWLAKKGYDPKMGARPLARVIQKHIKVPLSKEMLFGSLKSGGTAVVILDGDELKIETKINVLAVLDVPEVQLEVFN